MKQIKVGHKTIGPDSPIFIVAEVGQNHNGDAEIAKKLVDVAVDAGVDAVKFCKRDIKSELTKEGYNAPYEGPNSFGRTYGEHRENLELSPEEHGELARYCDLKGVIYFCSACDLPSVDLMEEIGVPLYKIASRDLTNLPLLEYIARLGKPMLISTGMSTLDEVDDAVSTVRKYNDDIVLMQCTSQYPADYRNINLRVLQTYRERYQCLVGYSGHTIGILMPAMAVALGAVVVEKHITLARYMKGTDHACSLESEGLRRVVRDVRHVEQALGDGVKRIYEEEIPNREKLARSIVAASRIPKGKTAAQEDLTIKSPGTGLKTKYILKLIGKRARRNIAEEEMIRLNDFE